MNKINDSLDGVSANSDNSEIYPAPNTSVYLNSKNRLECIFENLNAPDKIGDT